jgi:hypothetical protein
MPSVHVCLEENLCFECGKPMLPFRTSIVDASGAIRKLANRPEMHLYCARARIEQAKGTLALWTVREPAVLIMLGDIAAFALADAAAVEWYADGKPAMREQAIAAIKAGVREILEEGPGTDDAEAEFKALGLAVRALVPNLPRQSSPDVGQCIQCRAKLDSVEIISCTVEHCPTTGRVH